MTLAPYDALLLLSYGGPNGPADVLPFLRNATAGRGIPDERLRAVGGHYDLFDGVSPLNACNDALAAALGDALAERGASLPIVVGNRNWHPFLIDTLAELDAAGARRVLVVLTSAYASYSGCRQYREDLALALNATGLPIEVDKIGPYASSPGFVRANADALVAAAAGLDRPRVLFVTHALPLAMNEASGPGTEAGRYTAQHLAVADAVVREARGALGFTPEWELVYCSRSGPPTVPWLTPDVNDRLVELAADDVREVVVAPIGFVYDHMEVVYDLDTQAGATASELGITLRRAATAGTHPAFVGELADRIVTRARVANGDCDEPDGERYRCAENCCGSGRPGRAKPAACSA